MKNQACLPIVMMWIVTAAYPVQAWKPNVLKSRVTAATVYINRAMVTRNAYVKLNAGQHDLLFDHLTPDLMDETVRVAREGTSAAKILDVTVETVHTDEIQTRRLKQLQNSLDSLKQLKKVAEDQLLIFESQKAFVESLRATSSKEINRSIPVEKPSIQDWENMLKFYNRNLTEIYRGMRKQNLEKQKLSLRIEAIQKQIASQKSEHARTFKNIRVILDMLSQGELDLEISYIVQQATWFPMYDARVSYEDHLVQMTYFGMVQQNTGEDWKNIRLTLSTAEPMLSKSLPRLNPWYLRETRSETRYRPKSRSDIQTHYRYEHALKNNTGKITGFVTDSETGEPLIGANVVLTGTSTGAAAGMDGRFTILNVKPDKYQLNVSMMGYQRIAIPVNVFAQKVLEISNISLNMETLAFDGVAVVACQAGVQPSYSPPVKEYLTFGLSDVQSTPLSSVFEIRHTANIMSDHEPHNVTIVIETLPIDYTYETIPKVIPKVFLKGIVRNTLDLTFLNGEMNVFMDNEYINQTVIGDIVPNDSFEIALGIDESIQIERKLINRFTEKVGVLNNRKRVTFDYEIIINNLKSTEETLVIQDQMPHPQVDAIKVKLLKPEPAQIQVNKQNIATMTVKLTPRESKTIPFQFQIDFPADANVSGLNE